MNHRASPYVWGPFFSPLEFGDALFIRLVVCFSLLTVGVRAQGNTDLAEQSRRAKELMAEQRFAEAVPIYQRLLKAVPGNIGLLLNLALAEEMAGQPAQAIPHFETVLKSQPANVPALTAYSMALLELNRPKEAIAPLRKLLTLRPDDANSLGMLANAELDDHRFANAAEHYRQLTALNSEDPRAWYGLGKAYEGLAAASFDRLNKAAPQSGLVAALLADSRLDRRQFRSAFFFYKEAQKTQPDLPGIHAGLAIVYRETDHADWAAQEDERERAVATPDCRAQPAACSFLAGHLLEAVANVPPSPPPAELFWLTKAYNGLASLAFDHLSRLPESVQIHALKAQTLQEHRQPMEAAREWAAAVKLAPDDLKLKRERLAALFDAKDYQSVIAQSTELLAQDPQSPELNFLLGASLLRAEQPEKALPYLQQSIQAAPASLPTHAALGLALAALNRNEEAIAHLQKALALDDDGSMHYSLARALRAAGRTQQADEAMRQYQQIQKQNQQINGELAKEAEITAPSGK